VTWKLISKHVADNNEHWFQTCAQAGHPAGKAGPRNHISQTGRAGSKLQIWLCDPDHAHLWAILYINFVVLLPPKLYVKFERSTFTGYRNN